jgi:transposase-like protein
MMAELGGAVAHATIMHCVQRHAPEFEKRGARFAQPAGRSWRVDETYSKIRGERCYLHRAVDRAGGTVYFRVSAKRDVAAAKTCFRIANKSQLRAPLMIALGGCSASHRAVRELKAKLRSSKYPHNTIEQDHRAAKQSIVAMLGLKSFRNASMIIAGV